MRYFGEASQLQILGNTALIAVDVNNLIVRDIDLHTAKCINYVLKTGKTNRNKVCNI